MNRENAIYKKLLNIESLLTNVSSQDLSEENEKLKAHIKESNRLNGQLKGEITRLKNKNGVK